MIKKQDEEAKATKKSRYNILSDKGTNNDWSDSNCS